MTRWNLRRAVVTLAALLVMGFVVAIVAGAGPGEAKDAAAKAAPAGKSAAGKGGPAPAPVVAGQATTQAVPVLVQAVGTVEPIESVSVRPQVGGVITRVAFTDGQDVKAGQALFQIDPRPLQASLDAARAQLARDQAQAANAAAQSERYARLVEKDYVTREQADAARTQADVFAAAVQADQANVEQAKLNLAYATVTSPVAGRTGAVLVKKGNVVAAGGGPLVVVNQIDPIRVAFALPATQLGEVRRRQAAGPLTVRVRPSGGRDGEPVTGRLVFVDNAVGPNSGTVGMKAEFANGDDALWPGQFVDVEVELEVESHALTVPASAVVTGQAGTFVYVIDEAGKAQKKMVTVRRTVQGKAVIEGDVLDGQSVIVDGQMRVVPGAAVMVKGAKPAEGNKPAEGTKPAEGATR
jgi:multidrug efflux system membrane fusion protein